MVTLRVRSIVWFATGMVLTLVATLLVTQAWSVDAAAGDTDSTYVPASPCRLFDYRPAPHTVGARTTPLGTGEVFTQQVTGSNGDCVGSLAIPAGATAVALNVTAVSPTANSNLRVYPADIVDVPTVANLNFSAGDGAVANKVDVKLSPSGAIKLFNFAGEVSVVGDVAGYYIDTTLKELAGSVRGQLLAPSPLRVIATEAASLDDARTLAPETLLFQEGTIEIYAKCMYDTSTATVYGEMYVRTTADGAVLEGFDDLPGGSSGFLDIATLETDRQVDIGSASASNGAAFDETEGLIVSAEGKVYSILPNVGAKFATPTFDDGVYGPGDVCMFGGVVLG